MRFEEIRIRRFGRLRDLETGPEPLGPLVVVTGPNEAGKSTLFHFLVSLLYGYYPATRGAHPYTPWKDGDIEGFAVLRLEDGQRWEVRRRLLSSPTGILVRNGGEEDLRNLTLPGVRHVPRDLFLQAYALRLQELTRLEEESWAEIEDRLLGALGASDVRGARDVARELEEEAGALWRPNRRGNQRIRELEEEIREHRARRREAAERDRVVREKARRLEELRAELRGAREEREILRIEAERLERLLPVRERLRRIEELAEEAGPPELLREVPPDPGNRLQALRKELRNGEERLLQLRREREEAKEAAASFGDPERVVLAREEEIRSVLGQLTSLDRVHRRIGEVEQEIRNLDRRCRSEARALFSVPWEEVETGAVRRIPVGELRDRLRRYREAKESLEVLREARSLTREGSPAPRTHLLTETAVFVLALVLLALGIRGDDPLLVALGVVGGGLGGLLLYLRFRESGRGAQGSPVTRGREEELEERRLEERARVEALVRDLPLREGLLEDPPGDLADRLRDLALRLEERRDRTETLGELRREVEGARRDAGALAEDLDLPRPPEPEGLAHVLREAMDDTRQARARSETARREEERARKDLERVEEVQEDRAAALQSLEETLAPLGDGDPERGAEEALRRLDRREHARRLREELERQHPDLEDLRARIRAAEEEGEEWIRKDDAVARTRVELRELSGKIEEMEADVRGLERDVEHLREETTVDEVDGEIEALVEEKDRLIRLRDRKAALARLVREVDRRFREAHQPDVLRRAGEYLEVITDGRYDGLYLGDDPGEGPSFYVRDPALDRPVPVEGELSTGTREQVYLALRLAAVDHLDADTEPLPLFVDEAFVNWDRSRRRRGFRLLARVAERRQVFTFTCHEDWAEDLQEEGARVVRLEMD